MYLCIEIYEKILEAIDINKKPYYVELKISIGNFQKNAIHSGWAHI